MKTPGMTMQIEALRRSRGREYFAYLMEMGTGKTWTALADAERAYAEGRIDGLFVIAPKGVHTNWVRREIPMHLGCAHIAVAYRSGDKTRRQRAAIDSLFAPREIGEPPPLRILTMNIDAIITDDGFELAERFLNATRAMMVIDESARIKNLTARRTKRILTLRPKAVMRRIMSGLPVANAPLDLFSQMEFLESGLLGTTSYRAFVAEYAELLPENHGLVKHAKSKQRNRFAPAPQIVATDEDGRPRWRNLDKLRALIEPHSYRALKKDCLDLPPKIYTIHPFELTPKQRRFYAEMEESNRIMLGPEPTAFAQLAATEKLRQITSGFVLLEGEPRLLPIEENPRAKAFADLLEDIDGQFIVWAHFREELAQIVQILDKLKITHAQYHGGVDDKDREAAVDDFQSGKIRAFVGQPQAGGIGLTLTAAQTVIYYSNDFNLDTRKQSEDRAHRRGTEHPVVYIDLVAADTRDEKIALALQSKSDMAAALLGDKVVASLSESSDT